MAIVELDAFRPDAGEIIDTPMLDTLNPRDQLAIDLGKDLSPQLIGEAAKLAHGRVAEGIDREFAARVGVADDVTDSVLVGIIERRLIWREEDYGTWGVIPPDELDEARAALAFLNDITDQV